MRPEKEAIAREIKEQLSGATFAILTDFTRMDTAKTALLRRKLRETEARFQVVPNRLFRVVAKEVGYAGIEAGLKGPTALVYGAGDVAATAKVLLGGGGDADHLADIERLIGYRERSRTQRSWNTEQMGHSVSEQHERLPLMTVDELRRMPNGTGLLSYRNRRPVLLELEGWTQRRDGREISDAKRDLERDQQAQFAAQARDV